MTSPDRTDLTNAPAAHSIEAIAHALGSLAGADEWQIELQQDDESQLYLIADRPEERRAVTNLRARITLHNDHAPRDPSKGPRARGTAIVTLLPEEAADPTRMALRLRDGVAMAALTDNPPFRLPPPPTGGFPAVQIIDPALEGDMAAAAPLLAETLDRLRVAVAAQPGVRLSSAELYATTGNRTLLTSTGVAAQTRGTLVFLDFVLIASEGGREAEFHAELRRRRLADLVIEETVAAYATYARDALRAVTPATYQGTVILSGEAAANFFVPGLAELGLVGPFIFHTSAQAAYQRVARLTLGQPISGAEPRGDRLTLTSDSTRPYGTKTALFDGEGLPASTIPLIEDGVLRHLWADARYATYLDIAPTGALGNLTVHPGTASIATLRSASPEPIYEIVSFSSYHPDAISGDVVAEIRLGYRHDAGGATPIKGGSLVGNAFAALADVRLSQETYSDGRYHGPAALRFANLTIAGE